MELEYNADKNNLVNKDAEFALLRKSMQSLKSSWEFSSRKVTQKIERLISGNRNLSDEKGVKEAQQNIKSIIEGLSFIAVLNKKANKINDALFDIKFGLRVRGGI